MAAENWGPVGPDLETIRAECADPLYALSQAEMPAIMLRGAYDPDQCTPLIQRFYNMGLARNPEDSAYGGDERVRTDIGTSLGIRGSDQERFFQHSEATHHLFKFLFEGFDNPVDLIYDSLSALAPEKQVRTAYEPDGRRYGPAIFRIHYHTQLYLPHIDSVRLREARTDYAVYRFDHQFAGVLCLQNADEFDAGTQAILHRCLWTEDVQPYIAENTFHEYAGENGIENCRVELEPGDLYFFNTRCIHEVPPVQGNNPRIVLAVFIGYSADDDEIFVWS